MKGIVAVDEKWGIGKDNGLLFGIREDMKFFRETTKNKVVVMGSNTLRSLPNGNPLKNRVNVVLSKTLKRDDCIVVNDTVSLGKALKEYDTDDVYVIGGAKVYKLLLDYCEEILVTKVRADGQADVFFENLDELPDWRLVDTSQPVLSDGYTITFNRYKNLKQKEL